MSILDIIYSHNEIYKLLLRFMLSSQFKEMSRIGGRDTVLFCR